VKIARKSKKPITKSTATVSETDDVKRKMLKKKRKNRIKRRMTVFVFLVACIGIIVAVLTAPFFNVKTAYCMGQRNMTEAEMLQMAQIQTGKNIFMGNIRTVQKRLAENPEIAEVRVHRVFPDKIKIEVVEAKPVAYVGYDSQFLMINLDGKIIKVLQDEEMSGVAKIEGIGVVSTEPGTQIAAEDDARAGKLFECMNVLSQLEMLDKTNYINFADLSDLQLDYENRLFMLLGGYENMEYKLKFCKKVIDDSISEYEKALFDYRSDKLYVGPRETPYGDNPEDNSDAAESDSTETDTETTDKTETNTETPPTEE
jgi:hypothetical protein